MFLTGTPVQRDDYHCRVGIFITGASAIWRLEQQQKDNTHCSKHTHTL